MFWAFVTIFLICEFGHRIGDKFEETNRLFDQLSWYTFPVGMWRMLPTILLAAQQPVRFDVFGSISCSRNDFRKVWLQKQLIYLIKLNEFQLNLFFR